MKKMNKSDYGKSKWKLNSGKDDRKMGRRCLKRVKEVRN